MSPRTCDDGCNGCDECTDYEDYEDEPREAPEFGGWVQRESLLVRLRGWLIGAPEMSDHTELVEQTTAELDLLAQDMDLTDDERLTCSRASDTLQRQAEEIEALRADAERWQALYRRAINEANGLTNYVEERPELTCAERRIAKIEADARAAMQGVKG